jgi:hypothetical protein
MKNIRIVVMTIFSLVIIFLTACGPSKQVSRIDAKEVTDLSGRWNDTDSRLVAEEMIQDLLKRNWIIDFMTANGKKPVVIVGKIRNKSKDHIELETFTKDIERELINSGRVTFVASKEEREQVREERKDQQDFSSPETFKEFYKEIGADYLMSGVINSIEDAAEGEKVIYYQVDLELIDIETNTKAWLGNKKIKKYIGQDKFTL